MIANKKKFFGGLLMLVLFFAVLVAMFLPIVEGRNALEYADGLYNSISKGSAYYIPALREEIAPLKGSVVDVSLALRPTERRDQTAQLYRRANSEVSVSGDALQVTGDLGLILEACLDDADALYANDSAAIEARYGRDGREALYDWWESLRALDKALKNQVQFAAAEVVNRVMSKAVEPAYNYIGVEPQKITDRLGIVIFSLFFYVFYTLWYGFAIMFLFEGWGFSLE
jgi:hypothetical protein